MDVTGLKGKDGVGQGKYVVRTQDIDVTKLLTGVAEIYEGISGGQSIAEILFDTVLAINVGDFIPPDLGLPISGTLEQILNTLVFAKTGAQIIDLENGGQRIIIPSDLSLIMSFVPTIMGMLPTFIGDAVDLDQIYDLVFDLTGLDLNKLEHLKGASIDLIAEVGADGKLDSLDMGVGIDFESSGKDPNYGKYFENVDMNVIINKLAFNEGLDVDVEQAMADRGIDISSAAEYSLLTFNLALGLTVNTADKTLTLGGISPAL
jgi:hypothetical protein